MTEQLELSKSKWNQTAGVLDRWDSDYYKETFKGYRLRSREKKVLEFLDKLNLPPNSKILELGYGAGVTSAKILERGFNLHGVDLSEPLREIAIANCRRVGGRYKLAIGDAENLNYADGSFDGVIGLGFIHYMKSPLRCLQEVNRVLKKNGYLIIGQENISGLHCLDSPTNLLCETYRRISTPNYEFDYRNTFLLDLFLITSKFFGLSIRKRFENYKRMKLPKKHFINYDNLKNYILKSGLQVVGSAAAGFYSVTWHNHLPRSWSDKLQKLSDQRKYPFRFGNSVVFVAQKR